MAAEADVAKAVVEAAPRRDGPETEATRGAARHAAGPISTLPPFPEPPALPKIRAALGDAPRLLQ